MTGPSPNREALIAITLALGSLQEEMVFVGGQVAELLITDPVAIRIRPTDDVDVSSPQRPERVTTGSARSSEPCISGKTRARAHRFADGALARSWCSM